MMKMLTNSTVQRNNTAAGVGYYPTPVLFRRFNMKFIIMGINRCHPPGKDEVYGVFSDRAECYRYLNKLKTGCLGTVVSFYVKEE